MTLGRRSTLTTTGLVGVFAFLASLTQLRDWDTFHHLAYGREVFRGGGLPREESFLYPLAGQPAGPPLEWLSSVMIYLSWRVLGDAGPVFFAATLVAILAMVLLMDARDGDPSVEGLLLAVAPVVLMLAVYRGRAVARPEVLANILIAGTMMLLRSPLVTSSRGGLLVGLAIVLWANLHPSVLLGVGFVAIFALVNGARLLLGPRAPVSPAETQSLAALGWPIGGVAAGVVMTGMLTPVGFAPFHGVLGLVLPILGFSQGSAHDVGMLMKQAIGELQPMSPQMWLGPLGWLVVVTVISGLVGWRRANLRELITCAATIFLAVRAQRFTALAMIVMAPVASRHVRAALSRAMPGMQPFVHPGIAVVTVAGVIAACWLMFTLPWLRFGVGVADHVPARAVDYLQALDFRGRLFNTFHFGGYLEWRLDTKVYQDGRVAVPPGELALALAGPSSATLFNTLDDRYKFEALVLTYPRFTREVYGRLATSAPDIDLAADRGKWALVAFDDGGLLYLRRDGQYSAQAARDEYRFARPANLPTRLQGAPGLDRAAEDFERSLRESPRCSLCAVHLGFARLAERRFGEAKSVFRFALEGPPENQVVALMGLARAEEELGDRAAAERHLRSVLSVAKEPQWPRRELARLLASSGRFAEALSTIRKNAEMADAAPIDLALGAQIARDAGDEALARRFAARLGSEGSQYNIRAPQ